MTPVLLVAAAVSWALAAYRWLRVAQREHYEPGRVTALALLWATRRPENAALYRRYEADADALDGVTFVGRLATYKYYNMDQVVGQALATFKRLRKRHEGATPAGQLDDDDEGVGARAPRRHALLPAG